jgi:hypothetical protein
VDPKNPVSITVDWHPNNGKLISMPNKDAVGDIVVIDRLRWGRKPFQRLSGVHTNAATLSLFSPNGAQHCGLPLLHVIFALIVTDVPYYRSLAKY